MTFITNGSSFIRSAELHTLEAYGLTLTAATTWVSYTWYTGVLIQPYYPWMDAALAGFHHIGGMVLDGDIAQVQQALDVAIHALQTDSEAG